MRVQVVDRWISLSNCSWLNSQTYTKTQHSIPAVTELRWSQVEGTVYNVNILAAQTFKHLKSRNLQSVRTTPSDNSLLSFSTRLLSPVYSSDPFNSLPACLPHTWYLKSVFLRCLSHECMFLCSNLGGLSCLSSTYSVP